MVKVRENKVRENIRKGLKWYEIADEWLFKPNGEPIIIKTSDI